MAAVTAALTCSAANPSGAAPRTDTPTSVTPSTPMTTARPTGAPQPKADPQLWLRNWGLNPVRCIYYDNESAWLDDALPDSGCDPGYEHVFTVTFTGSGYRYQMTDYPGHCLGVATDQAMAGSWTCDSDESLWEAIPADGRVMLKNVAAHACLLAYDHPDRRLFLSECKPNPWVEWDAS
ncbi:MULTISPECIES: hypothetical protein [unclassified Nocardia]|uniref:hypothetical protein n=1 Tax=unclassified Nocardia TaxID=2637762 RepID=UPI001CE3BE8E|nr:MULTISPECIES: hypothetical protein [unclassified Nocardia]